MSENFKNMTFDQLVIEWEKISKKQDMNSEAMLWSNIKPAVANKMIDSNHNAQIPLWAIESEIISEYRHLVPSLKNDHHDLYACIVTTAKYKNNNTDD